MFLSEPAETRFDLRFWIFGTHVRVHPWFWLLSAILGWNATAGGGPRAMFYLAVWVACVFVSVLVHELGHVLMGRLFGSYGHIVLYSFGGLAVGSNALKRGWQRFLVCFAGPLIQFGLLVVVLLAYYFLLPHVPPAWQEGAREVITDLFVINLFWPLLNLLPIWPLDGGQMMREVFLAASPRNSDVGTLTVSACTAGLAAFHCMFPQVLGRHVPLLRYFGGTYLAIFFGLLCAQSIMALQSLNARRRRSYDEEQDFPWER